MKYKYFADDPYLDSKLQAINVSARSREYIAALPTFGKDKIQCFAPPSPWRLPVSNEANEGDTIVICPRSS